MSVKEAVAILGRGPGRSRSLTMDEATAAMREILNGSPPPEAVGALLMLLRMKGETAEEIAGFVRAARDVCAPLPRPDLDWPVYAAGRTRGLPWFLQAADLVSQTGRKVLLHGWSPDRQSLLVGLVAAEIPVVRTSKEAEAALASRGIAYFPLEALSPELLRLLQLRDAFGLRSCINTCLRVLNPFGARASVQGVFHPSYRLLQADAGALLGQDALTVIKGGGGEFERNPSKTIEAFGLRDGVPWTRRFPSLLRETRRLADEAVDLVTLTATDPGPWAEAIVTGTAALALDTLGVERPGETASALWARRKEALAA